MGFHAIVTVDGLSGPELERVLETAPDDSRANPGYVEMMEMAGFVDVEVTDTSDEYAAAMAAWVDAWDDEADEIGPLVGEEEFDRRQRSRRRNIELVGEGLLKRVFVTGRKPL